MPRLGVFAAALIAAAARAGANNGCSFCDESWEGGPGDGCYACDTAECGPDLCPDECPEQCPDGREFLCKTFSVRAPARSPGNTRARAFSVQPLNPTAICRRARRCTLRT